MPLFLFVAGHRAGWRRQGTRLFTDQQELRLIEARPFDNGVILLRYDVLQK